MKYYRLIDDINYPNRWYLGDILNVDDNWQFVNGEKTNLLPMRNLVVEVYRNGQPMDYTITEAYGVPVVNGKIKDALCNFKNLQFIPIAIDNKNLNYFIMVATKKGDYVDENLSEFAKFLKNDPVRPDKEGHYSWFAKLVIDATKTDDNEIFRINKGEPYLIVSQKVKQIMENTKATGLKFIEL